MKIKCNDGIVRRFQPATPQTVVTAYGPKETGYMGEARCLECGEQFGVHDTLILKPRFREHSCKNQKAGAA
jgi:hypothetical protein